MKSNQIIPFMDLKRQCKQYKDEMMKAIEKVLDETAFAGGKYVEDFEEAFASYQEVSYCSGVNSGTAALELAVRALQIGSGDEVIVPANTFIASAWGGVHAGATPIFVDCKPDTWEIDEDQVANAITNRTKAIIGVHLYGQPFNVDLLKEIAQNHGIFLIEDCAQAHGAKYKGKKVGALGDVGCFSFYPGKNLGAYGEAGAVVTNDRQVYKMVEILKNHGAEIRYQHDFVGFNMRMEGIQGAVLKTKLKYLDEWNARRQAIARAYYDNIRNEKIVLQATPKWAESVHHLFVIEVEERERFLKFMRNKGILCGKHYPIPCHLQKAFRHLGYKLGDCPNAERLAERCASLPMFPELTEEEVEIVIEACNSYR